MPAVAVVNRPARNVLALTSPCAVLPRDSRRRTPGLFAGVADWPDIDDLFTRRSLSILASDGFSAWHEAGGRHGYDGLPGFGAISGPALTIVQDLADTFGGFRWTDDAGTAWAVRFADDAGDNSDRMAFAVSYGESAWVIDRWQRDRMMQALRTELAACSGLAPSWNNADRARCGFFSRALHRLRLVDDAEQVLRYLVQQAHVEQGGAIVLSAAEIEAARKADNEEARPNPTISELTAVLRATLGFEIARLRLGSLGWNPRFVQQSAAVTSLEQVGDETFRIGLSPWFSVIAAAFARAVNPRNTRRSLRRVTPLILASSERHIA